MKLSIDKLSFLKALSHGQGVIEKRNTVAILSHVLLEAQENALRLTCTDLELAVIESVEAVVMGQGRTAVSAQTLYDIVRKLPDGFMIELCLNAEATQLVISSGRSEFKLPCLPALDFPAVAEGELPHQFVIKSEELKFLIDRTRFAMSTEETRYFLNGIYLHAFKGQHLRAVATDGHRLALAELPLPANAHAIPGVILSRKTVQEVRKLADELGGEIAVSLSENQVRFAFAKATLTSRLVEGTFPDYERAIPYQNTKIMRVASDALSDAVDRISILAQDKTKAVKINITDGMLVVSSSSSENGNAVEELEVDYTAEAMDISFNARYVLDVTQQFPDSELEVLLGDAGSPVLLRNTGQDNMLFVLMPMRV